VTLAGIVLAGGRSRRMGADKASLDWRGRPLVVHVAAIVRSAVDGPVVVVGAPGRALPSLPAGVEAAADATAGRGPLEGLAAGLEAVGDRAEAAFACATDMPLITADLVERLHEALQPGDDAVAVMADGVLQPLAAVYRTRLAATARARLGRGEGSLTGLLNAVSTRTVDAAHLSVTERAGLRSLDTPEAYSDLEQRDRVQHEQHGEHDRPAGEVALHQRAAGRPAGDADAERAGHPGVLPRVEEDREDQHDRDEDLRD
jgi:molybdopterin-guanine dinucleotide biosynthesis protein A